MEVKQSFKAQAFLFPGSLPYLLNRKLMTYVGRHVLLCKFPPPFYELVLSLRDEERLWQPYDVCNLIVPHCIFMTSLTEGNLSLSSAS